MTCEEFRDAVMTSTSVDAVEALIDSHVGIGSPAKCQSEECAEAIQTARILAEPLAEWSCPIEIRSVGSLADRVADEVLETRLSQFSAPVAATQRSTRYARAGYAAATTLAVLIAAAVYFRPGVGEQNGIVAGRTEAQTVDPIALAYAERTERWLAEATRASVPTEFEVSLEVPEGWLNSTLLPLAETLQEFVPADSAATETPAT